MEEINVETFRLHPTDTGSPEVQVAQLSKRILRYQKHFETHKTDRNNKRGLHQTIGQRRKLLLYLRSIDVERYRDLIKRLGIRPLPT